MMTQGHYTEDASPANRPGFLSWARAVAQVTKGQVIAIDGKTLRRSHDRYVGKEAIHMVSAWATANPRLDRGPDQSGREVQ